MIGMMSWHFYCDSLCITLSSFQLTSPPGKLVTPLWSLSGHVPLPSHAFLYRFVHSFRFVLIQLFSIAFYWMFQLSNGFSGREKIAKATGITFRLSIWYSFASSSWISRTSKTSWSRCDRRQSWRNATSPTSQRASLPQTVANNDNELNLHGHKRDLQHCKSILTITITKSKSNNNIKLSIINCVAFPNRMLRIALTAC